MRTIDAFEGHWHLGREIEDHRAGHTATFEGHADVKSEGRGWVYREAGLLHMPGVAPIKAERRYIWNAPEPGLVAVCFEDGRPFHVFQADGGLTDAAHWCDPDQYNVRYNFADWPIWTSTWTVTGPRKNYVMRSAYRR